MGRRGRPRYPDILTPREWEVLALLREDLTNDAIAARLGVTHAAAKYHVSQILSKLGVATREAAAAWVPAPAEATAEAGKPRLRWWWSGVGGWLRPVTVGKAALIGAAVAVVAGLGVLAWGVLREAGEDSRQVAVGGTPSVTPTAAATPTPGITPAPVPQFGEAFVQEEFSGDLYAPGLYAAYPGGGVEQMFAGRTGYTHYESFATSPDGRFIVSPKYDGGISSTPTLLVWDLWSSDSPVELNFSLSRIAIAPGTGHIAGSGTIDGISGLYIISPGGEPTLVTTEVVLSSTWSPAGTRLASVVTKDAPGYGGGSSVMLVDSPGSPPRMLWDNAGGPVWSPDGSRLLIKAQLPNYNRVWLVLDSQGNGLDQVPYPDSMLGPVYRWEGDTRGTFYVSSERGEEEELRKVDLQTGDESLIVAGSDFVWSPDGEQIAYSRAGQVYAMNLSDGSETRISNTRQPFVGWPRWLSDGRVIFAYQPPYMTSIYVANGDGSAERRIADGSDPHWSPDGNLIAFDGWTTGSGLGGSNHIYVMRPDGTSMRRVGGYGWSDVGPRCVGLYESAWSPDSRYVSFGYANFTAVVTVDGSEPPRALGNCPSAWSPVENRPVSTEKCELDSLPSPCLTIYDVASGRKESYGSAAFLPGFSPDGLQIAFVRDRTLWRLDLQTRRESRVANLPEAPQQQTPFGTERVAWSPDGQWIAVASTLVRADGSDRKPLPGGFIRWSPRSEAAVFVRSSQHDEVQVLDPDTGQAVLTVPALTIDWSPDGNQIIYDRWDWMARPNSP